MTTLAVTVVGERVREKKTPSTEQLFCSAYLLATDCCHGNRWSCSVALNGDSDVTRDFRGDGDVALVGSWRWGNETARHGRLQDSLQKKKNVYTPLLNTFSSIVGLVKENTAGINT